MRSRLVSILAVAVAACGRDAPAPPTFTTRDSAGIEIVESTLCSWGGNGSISIDEAPYLSIGEAGDNVPYRFIEITDAMTLPDGRIAVADQGSGQVRVYDTEGEHLVSFGRAGDGDGEFRSITRLLWWEDRLWAFDSKRALMSSFGGLNNVERIERVPTRPGQLPIEDVLTLDDGSLLAFDGREVPPRDTVPTAGSSARIGRNRAHITSIRPDDSDVRIDFPGAWTVHRRDENGAGSWGHIRNTTLPSWTTDGSRIYYAPGDRFEVSVADGTGTVHRILRGPGSPPRPTEADFEAWRADILPRDTTLSLVGFPPEAVDLAMRAHQRFLAEARATLANAEWPDAMPVYERLLVDPTGAVWARHVGEGNRDWDVYAANCSCLGTVRMPAGLAVFEIGEDYVLGRTAEQSDAERVQLHRLSRR